MNPDARAQLRAVVIEVIGNAPESTIVRIQGGWRRVGVAWTLPAPFDPRPLELPDEDARSARVEEIFRKYHSDHTDAVGLAGLGSRPFSGVVVLRGIVLATLARANKSKTNQDALDEVLDELDAFVDSDEVPLDCYAPLSNFTGPPSPIALPRELEIRALTDAEATALYAGRMNFGIVGLLPHEIPTYTLVRRVSVRKVLGSATPPDGDGAWLARFREDTDTAIRALRSFKAGGVLFRSLRFLVPRFALTGLIPEPFFARSPVQDIYQLEESEVPSLKQHASFIFGPLHESLDFACRRLSDAALRLDSGDRVVDAVTGLETILLWGQSGSELSFRFALHYSCLADPSVDRVARFNAARRAYAIRSRIVHGPRGRSQKQLTPAELSDLARDASEMLRETVAMFRPQGTRPAYATDDTFWITRILAR